MTEKNNQSFLTLKEAAELYLQQSKENPTHLFRVYCRNCDGWVVWHPHNTACPRCEWTIEEATALERGLSMLPKESDGQTSPAESSGLSTVPGDRDGPPE